ncbi:LysR family transcriptional regulator [Mycoavidus sp. HKI]|uniref:LysR family transcriptional regulator n=1 Tax=Mycoavidus sp. HKI TaxID=2840467 RepID=UPI001CC0FF93|nr:LysR family transcriptional regulator [Mycoavidus sp. HKI]UAW64707.1 LysR family transcriptional regulator [Mycoavidus sp. HKI]
MRYFYEVCARGKIRAAADNLNTDSSVITRQIRLLEKEVGVKPFERHRHGVTPTEAAELLLEYYRRNRMLQADFEAGLQELRGMQRGSIYIATLKAYSDLLVEDALSDFCSKYAHLNVSVKEFNTSDQVVTEILEDGTHIGIMSHHCLTDPEISYRMRKSIPICMLVNKSHPLVGKRIVTFTEVARYPIALPPPPFILWNIIRSVESAEKIQLIPGIISDSLAARKKFASIGPGGTLMSPLAAQQEIKAGQLVALTIDHPTFNSSLEFCLIVKAGRPRSPAINQLLELLEIKLLVCANKVCL